MEVLLVAHYVQVWQVDSVNMMLHFRHLLITNLTHTNLSLISPNRDNCHNLERSVFSVLSL